MALGQQGELHAPTLFQMAGRCRHFRRDFQAQQGQAALPLFGRIGQSRLPGLSLSGRDTGAQFLGAGQLLGLAVFPGMDEVAEHFTMGLGRQFAHGLFGQILRMAHGAESGIAQTRCSIESFAAI